MPSFFTVPFLLAVIVVGAGVSLSLLLLTVVVRIGRALLAQNRARTERPLRPPLLEAVAGEGLPEELITARGARGRAVERLAYGYLARVRGEGHALLAELLRRRGAQDRAIRQARLPGRNRRAVAASQLGLIASEAAASELASLADGDPSQRVRIVAARGLGKTGRPDSAEILVGLLPDGLVPEGIVASALLELGPEGASALRKVLARDDPGREPERAMAANVLGLLDELTAWQELAACLGSPDPSLRLNAVRALGRLGMPQASQAIIGCLAPGEDPALRAVAARALGRIRAPSAVPALARCLDAPGYWVAHNAAVALSELGEPGGQALAEAAAGTGTGAAHAREALTQARLAAGREAARGLPAGGEGAGPEPGEPGPGERGAAEPEALGRQR